MTNPTPAGATPANVAAQATRPDALASGELNLLGIFGPSENLSALVRLANGRVVQVETGARLMAGRIVAIDVDGLIVQQNGGTRRIAMPGG